MAGKRKSNALDLPARLYYKHGSFFYQHRKAQGGKLENLGTDIQDAKRKAELYNDIKTSFGSIAYWLDKFIISCEARIGLSKERKGLADRTVQDYKNNVVYLKEAFGAMDVTSLKPFHVAKYLEMSRNADRAVRANREKSCLSAAYTWFLIHEETGVIANPCIGIKRNPESKRTRYVTDAELGTLLHLLDNAPPQSRRAAKAVKALLSLVYRTLQRPADILLWTEANIIEMDGQPVICNVQGKLKGRTDVVVYIQITDDIGATLSDMNVDWRKVAKSHQKNEMTIIHTSDGRPYTYDGLSAIFQRHRARAQKVMPAMKAFGFYDLKAKGATDMLEDGVPLELIQHLAGHASKTTTEIYLKGRQSTIAMPNSRKGKLR